MINVYGIKDLQIVAICISGRPGCIGFSVASMAAFSAKNILREMGFKIFNLVDTPCPHLVAEDEQSWCSRPMSELYRADEAASEVAAKVRSQYQVQVQNLVY